MFVSTRSGANPVSGQRALLSGLAPDGGLYVPAEFPDLTSLFLSGDGLSYAELCTAVLAPFFPDIALTDLGRAAEEAASRFPSNPAPLASAGPFHFLELFHGPTLAFKDFALSLMGDLVRLSSEAENREGGATPAERLILVATSGDTGKAALAGFSDRPGIRIMVFYPVSGVSEIQRLQMLTHDAVNAEVVGIRGNFDDAQRGVKALFADQGLASWLGERGIVLGSANSINIGRLLPQVVYYVWAWREARRLGILRGREALDFVVPTGNFGDALAGSWARRMGLPVGTIIAATNRNRVIADFFESGVYDRNRDFHVSTSPSMDILAASNLERLLFELCGRDQGRVAFLMKEFSGMGRAVLSPSERKALDAAGFKGATASDGEGTAMIRSVYRSSAYLMDTHTAIAASVLDRIRANGSQADGPVVILSTASPFKFPNAVSKAIGLGIGADEAESAALLAAAAGLTLPEAVASLASLPLRHRTIVDISGMEGALRSAVIRAGK